MRRIVDPALCTFALVLACGDATGTATETTGASTDGTTGTTGTTEAATTDGATGAGESSTSDAPTGASAGGTTTTSGAEPGTTTGEPPVTTGGTTTTDATTTTTGDASTTIGTTGAPAQPVTRAWWVESLLTLQIRVIQRDVEAGLCRGFILESLANGGLDTPQYEPVEQPAEWGARYVFVHQDLDDCLDPYQYFEKDIVYAASATGTVTFHDVDPFGRPASVDLEITGSYMPAAPWVPAEDLLAATAVAVENG
ncbi:hypothetical protein SAMN02745121_08046 [Nannocystis exedens]|uniref:Uncharacterized protein n=1 Tax=Nannocystis exedens TaxID=54 RepID=A0A1I2HQC4_9BACT|nr:hypothetical protein [Nannocystis exedens]PCC71971.1 hypothetical protein NAEX_05050 [Nannocystis exedens]SFF30581.1 hypothetical protein SAMN02745121_08046 [Nannocystis exedens]